jgi:hypothetical protein
MSPTLKIQFNTADHVLLDQNRYLHACAKLKALSFLFSQANVQSGADDDVYPGLAYILEDALDELADINEAPTGGQS